MLGRGWFVALALAAQGCGLSLDLDPAPPVMTGIDAGPKDATVSRLDSGRADDDAGAMEAGALDASGPDPGPDAGHPLRDGGGFVGGTCDAPIRLDADPRVTRTVDPASGVVRLSFVDDTRGAARMLDGTCRLESGAPEMVFVWTAPGGGTISIDTYGLDGPSTFDTILYLRRDTCGGPEIACNDDADIPTASPPMGWPFGGERSQLQLSVRDGEVIYAVVDGWRATDAGPFGLDLRFEPTGAPGSCTAPFELDIGTTAGDSTLAVSHGEAFDTSCTCADMGWGLGSDLVYRFTATTAGAYVATIDALTFDPTIHVRQTCADATTERVCRDDPAMVMLDLVAGDSVYLFADACRGFHRGRFTITIARLP